MISDTQKHTKGKLFPMSNSKLEIFFEIGERLKEERKRIKITQEELSACLKLTSRTWGSYERGQSTPDAWILSELEKKGIDIYYVITGKKLPIAFDNPDEEKIIKQYRSADEEIKFAISSIFDAMKL